MTTSTVVAMLEHIASLIPELDPPAMNRRIKELRRGAPSPNLNSGGRGRNHEPPMPETDADDQTWNGKAALVEKHVRDAEASLLAALAAQGAVLNVAPVLKGDAPVKCRNYTAHVELGGDGYLEDGRRSGECVSCRVHRHRYGVTFGEPIHESTTIAR